MKKANFVDLGLFFATCTTHAQTVPNMPTKNPWLATSAFPISHGNRGGTEAVAHAGPTKGRKLLPADVKTVPNVFRSHPIIKNVRGERIIIASGVDGIRKIIATGENFEFFSFVPYPGDEAHSPKAMPPTPRAVL
jgi:hypothetical protein